MDHQVIALKDFLVGRPAGHSPAIVVFQLSVGGQDVGVLFAMLLNFLCFLPGMEFKIAQASLEFLLMEYLCIRTVRCHRPLKTVLSQAVPADTGKEGDDLGDFLQHTIRGVIGLFIPHPVHEIHNDLPVRFGARNGFHNLSYSLNAPFPVRKGSALFEEGSPGKDNVRMFGGFGHK